MSREIGQIVKDFYYKHILKIKTESEQQKDRDDFRDRGTHLVNKLNQQLYVFSDVTRRIQELKGDTEGVAKTIEYIEKLRAEMIEAGQNPEVELLHGQENLAEKLLNENDDESSA